MATAHHPTREKLIETTARLLKTMSRSELSSELILKESGISKGSLYHHFQDLDHVIESAMLRRYTDWVDQSISAMTYILTTGKNAQEIYDALTQVTERTQKPTMRSERIYRAEVILMADRSPRFAKELGIEQQRLTDALTDLIREVQEIGYYKKDYDPQAIAVFIQAYTLGRVVDDFSETPINPDNWNFLINSVIKKVFSTLE
jgi:AcrR family transcriptional regulator